MLNGVAISFIFVPLTTAAMGQLRQEQIGNATGIYNLMRNLGGSIGIAFVTTMIARRAQVHQALMVGHLTPSDPAYTQQLAAAQHALTRQQRLVARARAGARAALQFLASTKQSVGVRGKLPVVRCFVLGLPSAGFIIQTRAARAKTDRGALIR